MSQTRASPCELKPYYCFQNRSFDYQQKIKKNKKKRGMCFVTYSLSLFLTFIAACDKVRYKN